MDKVEHGEGYINEIDCQIKQLSADSGRVPRSNFVYRIRCSSLPKIVKIVNELI